jgi:hypothetical protein
LTSVFSKHRFSSFWPLKQNCEATEYFTNLCKTLPTRVQ